MRLLRQLRRLGGFGPRLLALYPLRQLRQFAPVARLCRSCRRNRNGLRRKFRDPCPQGHGWHLSNAGLIRMVRPSSSSRGAEGRVVSVRRIRSGASVVIHLIGPAAEAALQLRLGERVRVVRQP